ncbi:DUF2251 domain-containing protein [bacterium]|nr:DUF2251 domain-containing protein [bacterium]
MTKPLHKGAPLYIQSQSPSAPYAAIFEDDGAKGCFYAATSSTSSDPEVEDMIQVYGADGLNAKDTFSDIKIIWSKDGYKAALLKDAHLEAIFDFKSKEGFSRQTASNPFDGWKRCQLEFSESHALEFEQDILAQRNKSLKTAIESVAAQDSEITRLNLYKVLLRSTLLIPITTEDPTSKDRLFYTFPYGDVAPLETASVSLSKEPAKQTILCTFTDDHSFQNAVGQYGVSYAKEKADFIFKQVQKFEDIFAVLITTGEDQNVIIERKDFALLSLVSEPQSLDYGTMVASMSNLLIQNAEIDFDRPLYQSLLTIIKSVPTIEKGFFFQSTASNSQVILGLLMPEADEVTVQDLFRQFAKVLHSELEDGETLNISVLEENSFLHSCVEHQVAPFHHPKSV